MQSQQHHLNPLQTQSSSQSFQQSLPAMPPQSQQGIYPQNSSQYYPPPQLMHPSQLRQQQYLPNSQIAPANYQQQFIAPHPHPSFRHQVPGQHHAPQQAQPHHISRMQVDPRAPHLSQYPPTTQIFSPSSSSSQQGFSSEFTQQERFSGQRLSMGDVLRQQIEGVKDMAHLTSSNDPYAAENMYPLDSTASGDKIYLTHALSQLQDSVNKAARVGTDFTGSTSPLRGRLDRPVLQQKENPSAVEVGEIGAGANVRTDFPTKSSSIPILYASSDEGSMLRQRLFEHNMHPPLPVQALEVDISQKNVLGVVQTLVKEQTTLKQLRHLYAMELERVRQEQRLLKEAQETILLMDAVDTRELKKIQKKEKKEKARREKKAAQRKEKIAETRLESNQNLPGVLNESPSSPTQLESQFLSQPRQETSSNQFLDTKASQSSPPTSIPQLQELPQNNEQSEVPVNEAKSHKNVVMSEYSDDNDELQDDDDTRDGDSVLQFITDY